MALSRDTTASSLWREAVRDLNATEILAFEKYNLINRAVSTVAGQFYDLMSNLYMTEIPLVALGGVYENGVNGTYTASTKTLALNSPSQQILSLCVGRWVTFRISTSVYAGTISSVVNATSFVVDGTSLPSSDGILAEVMIPNSTIGSSKLILSGLRIMMTGEQIKIELASTVSGVTVKPATTREIDTFISSGRNAKTVLWALSGDSITFAYGDSVTGSLLLRYPKVPTPVSADTDNIDLPDGTAMEIATIYLRGLIQRRLNLPQENNDAVIERLIRNIYNTFGAEASSEVVKDKVLAVK
jgi:hypothetical protein